MTNYTPKPCPHENCPKRKDCIMGDFFRYWDNLRKECVLKPQKPEILHFKSKAEALEYLRSLDSDLIKLKGGSK